MYTKITVIGAFIMGMVGILTAEMGQTLNQDNNAQPSCMTNCQFEHYNKVPDTQKYCSNSCKKS